MGNQTSALIGLLSMAQDKLVSNFAFDFAKYEVFHSEAQSLIDTLRSDLDEIELSSTVNTAFALVSEIDSLI